MSEDFAVKVKLDFGAQSLAKELNTLVKSIATVDKAVTALTDTTKEQLEATKTFSAAIVTLLTDQNKLVKETTKTTNETKKANKEYVELANKVKLYANGLLRAANSSAVTEKHIVLLRDRLAGLKQEVKKLKNLDLNMPGVRSTLAETSVSITEAGRALREFEKELDNSRKSYVYADAEAKEYWNTLKNKVITSYKEADAAAQNYWKTIKQKVAASYTYADAAAQEHWKILKTKVAESYRIADEEAKRYNTTLHTKVADSYKEADAAAQEYWRTVKEDVANSYREADAAARNYWQTIRQKVAESYQYADAECEEYNKTLRENKRVLDELYKKLQIYSKGLLKASESSKLTNKQTALLKDKIARLRFQLSQLEKAGYNTDTIRRNLVYAREELKKTSKETNIATERTKEFVGWWKRFGQVAVGFTLAYRAINLIEDGLRKVVEIVKEGINLSGEFGAIQAKMALWGTMFPSNAKNFEDAMQKAAVNIAAFRKELPDALSNIEDLTQGMDELAQHGVFATEENMHKIVQFIDLTAMVAKASGSTVNQVRQEFQALFEGNVRAGNTLLILLRNLGVDTETLRNQIKSGVDVSENFDKIVNLLTEHVDKFKEAVWNVSIESAFQRWHKSYTTLVADSTDLASINKFGAETINIFAESLNRHAKELINNDELTRIWTKAINNLAGGFDSVLNISKSWFESLGKWLASVDIKGLVNTFGSLSISLANIGSSGLAISKNLVPALENLANAIKNVTNSLPSGIMTAAWQGIIVRWLFGSTPFGVIVASVSALINMAMDLKKAWDTGDASVLEKWVPQALVDRINKMAEGINNAKKSYTKWVEVVDANGNPLLISAEDYDRFMSLLNKTEGLVGKAGKFKLGDETKKEIEKAYNDIYSTFEKLVSEGKLNIAAELLDGAKDAIARQADQINTEIERVQRLYNEAIKRGTTEDVKGLKTLLDKLNYDLDETIAKLNSLDDAIPQKKIKIKINDLIETFNRQRAALKGNNEALKELASKTLEEVQALITKYSSSIDEQTKGKLESFKAKLQGLVSAHHEAAQKVSAGWENAYNRMSNYLTDWIESGKISLGNFFDWIKHSLIQAFSVRAVSSMAGWIGLPGAANWGGTAGNSNLFSSLFSGGIGQSLWQGLGGFGNSLMYGVESLTSDFSADLYMAGYDGASSMLDGLIEGMDALGPSAMGGLTAGIGTFLFKGLAEGDWAKAAASGGLVGASTGIGAAIGGAPGAAIGAIVGGLADMFGLSSLFGDGTEYAYLKSNVGYQVSGGKLTQTSYYHTRTESGEPMSWKDLRDDLEGPFLKQMTDITDSLIKQLSGLSPSFASRIEGQTFDFSTYWRAEDKESAQKSFDRNVSSYIKDVLGKITNIFVRDTRDAFLDVDLSLFSDEFKDTYTKKINNLLADIDFSGTNTIDEFNQKIDVLNQYMTKANKLLGDVNQAQAIYTEATQYSITQNGQLASSISDLNGKYLDWMTTLASLGVSVEKLNDLDEQRLKSVDLLVDKYKESIRDSLAQAGLVEGVTKDSAWFKSRYGVSGDLTAIANDLLAKNAEELMSFESSLHDAGYNLDDFVRDLGIAGQTEKAIADAKAQQEAQLAEQLQAEIDARNQLIDQMKGYQMSLYDVAQGPTAAHDISWFTGKYSMTGINSLSDLNGMVQAMATMPADHLIGYQDWLTDMGSSLSEFISDIKSVQSYYQDVQDKITQDNIDMAKAAEEAAKQELEARQKEIDAIQDTIDALDEYQRSIVGNSGTVDSMSYYRQHFADNPAGGDVIDWSKGLLESSTKYTGKYEDYLKDYITVMAAINLKKSMDTSSIERLSFADGGVISGPDSGYTVPVTFHGTEVITSENDNKEMRKELARMRSILEMILSTNGDQNKHTQRIRRVLDKWDTIDGDLVVTCVS